MFFWFDITMAFTSDNPFSIGASLGAPSVPPTGVSGAGATGPNAMAGSFAQHGGGADYTWVQLQLNDTSSTPTCTITGR